MRLAMFGATGRAGSAILRQACAAGYEVRALTRSPGKLDRDDPQVTVTAGDVRDLAATGRAVQGADAVVSAIGGTGPGNPALLQQGAAAILTAMNRHGVGRLIVIQGFHLPFPGDPRNLGRPVMAAMLRLWNRHLIADSYRMAEVLRESELDWTLIRMPPSAFRVADPDTLGALLVGAGLRDVAVLEVSHDWTIRDPAALFRSLPLWAAPMRPVLDRLTPAQIERAAGAFAAIIAGGLRMTALFGHGIR